MMLKYNGKAIKDQILGDRNGTPAQDAFEKHLRSLPDDEVFSSRDMIQEGFSYTLVKEKASRIARFALFTCLVNRQRFWGSIVAIEHLKKEYNAEN